jgi:hypothetical protein
MSGLRAQLIIKSKTIASGLSGVISSGAGSGPSRSVARQVGRQLDGNIATSAEARVKGLRPAKNESTPPRLTLTLNCNNTNDAHSTVIEDR